MGMGDGLKLISMESQSSDAPDCVDPMIVPKRILDSTAAIPAIGFGTFGSDHVTAEEVASAVREAIAAGYRHFDCAAVYGNERAIGEKFSTSARRT